MVAESYVFDRLTDLVRPAREISPEAFNGRYVLIPGEQPTILNGATVIGPTYLVVSPHDEWDLRLGSVRITGKGASGSQASDLTTAGIESIAERLRRTEPSRLIDVSPLLPRTDQRLRLEVLDAAVIAALPSLEAIGRDPYRRVRWTDEVVPVGQVRRMSRRASQQLAAHSEQWGRRTITRVDPSRLLAERADELFDIYENRLAVTAIENAGAHLDGRLRDVREQTDFLKHVSMAAATLQQRPWRVTRRLAEELGAALKEVHVSDAGHARHTLEEARRRVGAVQDSSLVRALRRFRVDGTPELTNLLGDDPRYRDALALHNAFRSRVDRTTAKQQLDMQVRKCECFNWYCGLLLLKAADRLGWTVIAGALGPRARLEFGGPEPTTLTWEEHGVLVVRADGRSLRVVPIYHALRRISDRRQATRLVQELSAMPTVSATRTLILYPASPADGVDGRDVDAELFDTLREEATRVQPSLLPVGPLEVESLERVSRAIRWVLDGFVWTRYPLAVPATQKEAQQVVSALAPFAQVGGNGRAVLIRRQVPPALLDDAVANDWVPRDYAWSREKANPIKPEVIDGIRAGGRLIKRLAVCPVCRTPTDASRRFEARPDGTFWCSCYDCGAEWGTRTCGRGHRYPVLIPPGVGPLPEHRAPG